MLKFKINDVEITVDDAQDAVSIIEKFAGRKNRTDILVQRALQATNRKPVKKNISLNRRGGPGARKAKWTYEEFKTLILNRDQPMATLKKFLPRRTATAIRAASNKIVGLERGKDWRGAGLLKNYLEQIKTESSKDSPFYG